MSSYNFRILNSQNFLNARFLRMTTMNSALDFVFSNLISGTYSGSSITFIPNTDQLIYPEGNRITLFDVARGQSKTLEVEHQATIIHVAVSPCGNYLISADRQNNLILSTIHTSEFCYQKKFKHEITALAFGPNGFAVASAKKLTLYNHPTQITALKPFVSNKRVGGHYDSINSINFSSDGLYFTTTAGDLTIRLFMTEPDEDFVPITLAGHRGKPLFAMFSPKNDRIIYSLGADGSFFVWQIQVDNSIAIISKRRLDEENFEKPKHRFQNITAAALNGDSLVAGFSKGSFKTYVIPNDHINIKSSATINFSTEKVRSVSLSNRYAAITSQKLGELVIWDLQSGSVAQRTMSHYGGVSCFDYSPNGIVVATGGDDGKLKIWDTSTGRCLMTFDEHKGPISDVYFCESGRTVVTASYDGQCKAFDIVRGRCFRTFTPPEKVEFAHLAVDSNFEFVAACGRGTMSIYLWSAATGNLLEELTGHTMPVSSLNFTPLTKLVSGSWDHSVRVWDFLDAHSSVAYEAKGEVTDTAISPDGKVVAFSDSNGRITFYNLSDDSYIGEVSVSLDARGGKKLDGDRSSQTTRWFFDSIAFSPDSQYIVCGGKTKFICIYSVRRNGEYQSPLLMRRIQHTINSEFSGIEGYVKKYHGSGLAQQIMDAKLGKRQIIEAAVNKVRWCPTGRGIAAATPEGLLVYVSSDQRIVDPIELEIEVTPQAVEKALEENEFLPAVVMSIKLGHTERPLLLSVLTKVPIDAIDFVASRIPTRFVSDFLQFLAETLRNNQQVELIMWWCFAVLRFHSRSLLADSAAVPAAHLLQRSLSSRLDVIKKTARENLDLLNFLCEQPDVETEEETE